MTKVLNVVEQVWVEKGVGETYLIKYKKLYPLGQKRPLLLATLYDEFHAREMRVHFRRLYGLDPNSCSSADYLNRQSQKVALNVRKAFNLNMKSKNKIVREHQKLAEQILLELEARKPFDPAIEATKILSTLRS